MEMVYMGIAARFLGWLVGRALKLPEVDTIVMLTMAGGGATLAGLAYLWIADITLGPSGTLMWFIVRAIGGVAGIVTYLITRYADWAVGYLKRNGLL